MLSSYVQEGRLNRLAWVFSGEFAQLAEEVCDAWGQLPVQREHCYQGE